MNFLYYVVEKWTEEALHEGWRQVYWTSASLFEVLRRFSWSLGLQCYFFVVCFNELSKFL